MSKNESRFESEAYFAIEGQLDDLIAKWAMNNHLTAEQAAIIRRNIGTSSAVLSFAWWWDFFKSIGLVEREHRIDTHAASRTVLAKAIKEVVPGWSVDSKDSTCFIPYLSLV